jgi:hypothetical protein
LTPCALFCEFVYGKYMVKMQWVCGDQIDLKISTTLCGHTFLGVLKVNFD